MLGPAILAGIGALCLSNPRRKKRRVKGRRRNPGNLESLALKTHDKTLSFSDIIPLVKQADGMDMRGVNLFYLDNWAAQGRLPEFELHLGDDVVHYAPAVKSGNGEMRILLRSGLEDSPKYGRRYTKVEPFTLWMPSARGAKKLAQALFDRVKGVQPWYNSGGALAWKFTKANPRSRVNPSQRGLTAQQKQNLQLTLRVFPNTTPDDWKWDARRGEWVRDPASLRRWLEKNKRNPRRRSKRKTRR